MCVCVGGGVRVRFVLQNFVSFLVLQSSRWVRGAGCFTCLCSECHVAVIVQLKHVKNCAKSAGVKWQESHFCQYMFMMKAYQLIYSI